MNEIPIYKLNENSYMASSVFLDEKYILLSPETPVSAALKKRLEDWKFKTVHAESDVSSESISDDASGTNSAVSHTTLEDNVQEDEHRNAALNLFDHAKEVLTQAFARFRVKGEIRKVELTELVKEMITGIKENKDYILSIPQNERKSIIYLEDHSVRTTFLALALADYMKVVTHKMIDLGIAAMLHKIGMLKLPTSLHTLNRQLSPQEIKLIQATPVIGFKLLKAVGFPMQICTAVLDHCERINGTGYPRNLPDPKINGHAKIIAVASSYSAAVANRPYREGKTENAGVMEIIRGRGTLYEEKTVKALLYTLSLYPTGTYIVMSDNSVAVVVKPNHENPKFPLIKLIKGADGSVFKDAQMVQTREGDDITIARVMLKNEIAAVKQQLES
jgi:HD-GYP domain-containing protein (c-di-GMP phosphodiesterase class II)